MIIEKIEGKNFLSFGPETQTLDLSDPGLFLISGKNEHNTALESNGAGKSSIMDLIVFALYGKVTKDLKLDEIINEMAQKECMSRLTMVADDGCRYVIERWIKHGKSNPLFLYKDTDGTLDLISSGDKSETQITIDGLIKFNYKSFINTVMMTQEQVSGFLNDDSSQKKEIIENILQLNVITKYGKVANEKRKLLDKRVEFLRTNRDNLGKIIANIKTSLEDYVASCKKKKDEAADLIKTLETQLEDLAKIDIISERQAVVLHKTISESIKDMKHQQELIAVQSEAAKAEVTRLTNQLGTLTVSSAELGTKIDGDYIADAKRQLELYLEDVTKREKDQAASSERNKKRIDEINAIDFVDMRARIAAYATLTETYKEKDFEVKSILTSAGVTKQNLDAKNAELGDILLQIKNTAARSDAVSTKALEDQIVALRQEYDHVSEHPDECPVCHNALKSDDLIVWKEGQSKKIEDVAEQISEKKNLIAKYQADIIVLEGKKESIQTAIDTLTLEESKVLASLQTIKQWKKDNPLVVPEHTEATLFELEHERTELSHLVSESSKSLKDDALVAMHEEKIQSRVKEVDGLKLQRDEIQTQIKALSLDVTKASEVLIGFHAQYAALSEKITAAEASLPVIKTEEELSTLDKQKSELEKKIEELKTKEYADKDYMKSLFDQIKKNADEKAIVDTDYAAAYKKATIMRWWENSFSSKKNSLKSWCVQTIIEYLNDRVKYYVDRFFDGAVSVTFDTELSETIESYDNSRTYGQFSGGEKRRLNVAILFALNELVKTSLNSSRLNLMMLDEVLGNYLDDRGVSTILDILQEKRDEEKVGIYVIEHKESFKEFPYFNQVNITKKIDGYSYIEVKNETS
jgi:DNA repair exonuclease SbcCD ATPase subunit